MSKGYWSRYPERKDGSRRRGYYWRRESRHSLKQNNEGRATVTQDNALKRHEEQSDEQN